MIRRRFVLGVLVAASLASVAFGFGGFRWGGSHYNRTEGAAFTAWLNAHGTTAEQFALNHPALAATFGPLWPDRSVHRIANRLDTIFRAYDSPLAGQGEAFARAGKEWDINPFLVAAIAGAESTFAREPCRNDEHNVFGWGSCRLETGFVDYKHAIFVVTRALRRTYINKHGDSTLDAIAARYCACGPNYAKALRTILGILGSGEGITFQAAREAVK